MPRSHNADGRSRREAAHIRLPCAFMDTPAWRALSPTQRATWLEVGYCYRGSNNGYLGVSLRWVAERLGISKSTAGRALNRLVEVGFLDVMEQGAFSVKHGRASEYRLTHVKCDRTGQIPTSRFQQWRPPEKQNTVSSENATVPDVGP